MKDAFDRLDAGEGPGHAVATPGLRGGCLDDSAAEPTIVCGQVYSRGHIRADAHAVAAGIDNDPGTPVVHRNEAVAEARPPEDTGPEAGALVMEHGKRDQRRSPGAVIGTEGVMVGHGKLRSGGRRKNQFATNERINAQSLPQLRCTLRLMSSGEEIMKVTKLFGPALAYLLTVTPALAGGDRPDPYEPIDAQAIIDTCRSSGNPGDKTKSLDDRKAAAYKIEECYTAAILRLIEPMFDPDLFSPKDANRLLRNMSNPVYRFYGYVYAWHRKCDCGEDAEITFRLAALKPYDEILRRIEEVRHDYSR
jgi:hypothetical protein